MSLILSSGFQSRLWASLQRAFYFNKFHFVHPSVQITLFNLWMTKGWNIFKLKKRQCEGGANGTALGSCLGKAVTCVTRLPPSHAASCVFLMKLDRLEQCYVSHLGFLCPSRRESRGRRGPWQLRSLSIKLGNRHKNNRELFKKFLLACQHIRIWTTRQDLCGWVLRVKHLLNKYNY